MHTSILTKMHCSGNTINPTMVPPPPPKTILIFLPPLLVVPSMMALGTVCNICMRVLVYSKYDMFCTFTTPTADVIERGIEDGGLPCEVGTRSKEECRNHTSSSPSFDVGETFSNVS